MSQKSDATAFKSMKQPNSSIKLSMQAVCTTAFVKDRESAKPSFCWPGKIPRQVPVLNLELNVLVMESKNSCNQQIPNSNLHQTEMACRHLYLCSQTQFPERQLASIRGEKMSALPSAAHSNSELLLLKGKKKMLSKLQVFFRSSQLKIFVETCFSNLLYSQ